MSVFGKKNDEIMQHYILRISAFICYAPSRLSDNDLQMFSRPFVPNYKNCTTLKPLKYVVQWSKYH